MTAEPSWMKKLTKDTATQRGDVSDMDNVYG
jgi:hypothetical protein